MSLNNDLKCFEEELSRIKEGYKQKSAGSECFKFGGFSVGKTSNLSLFSDGEVVFSHTAVHTFQKLKELPVVSEIHKNIACEMDKRGIKHFYLDKLDK